MEWTEALNRTIAFAEAHLRERLTVADLAKAAGISSFHLQRGFRIITGFSLGEYVRNRRLYCAALEVAGTERSILDIALDFQYETAESFTKAFSRFHGSTPSQVRSAGAKKSALPVTPFLPVTISIHVTGGNKMDYEVVAVKGFTVIGFEREFPFEHSYTTVPKFWDEISERYLDRLWGGKTPETPQEKAVMEHGIGEFGICIDGADNGKFRYLIAGAYKGGHVPDGMTTFDVPTGDWAKFRAVGPLPGSLQAVNTRVFKEWLPGNPDWEAAGQCNIEWYSTGDPNSPGYQSEIWLPVKRRK
ncbi:MAG: AraC family transcriptional regulator [Treponemataceae bacterium]|nr:AraC family transcriptional regulator [Treponemataceae bacterium]